MALWIVEMAVNYMATVEADTQEEAEDLALQEFDGTANDPYVLESHEVGEDDDL